MCWPHGPGVVKFHLACLRMIGQAKTTFCDRLIYNCCYQRSQAIPKDDNALLQAKFKAPLSPQLCQLQDYGTAIVTQKVQ